MKRIALVLSLVIALVVFVSTAAGIPQRKGHRWGSKSVYLCDRASFSFRVPSWAHYSNEKVNGHEIGAAVRGDTTWFFGFGVSGMWRQKHGVEHVSTARFGSGCVRLTVLWSEA